MQCDSQGVPVVMGKLGPVQAQTMEGIVADNVVELAMTQALQDAEAEVRSGPDVASDPDPERPSSATGQASADGPAAEESVSVLVAPPDSGVARAGVGTTPVRAPLA